MFTNSSQSIINCLKVHDLGSNFCKTTIIYIIILYEFSNVIFVVVHFALGKQLSVVTERGEIYIGSAGRRRHSSCSLDSFDQFTADPVTYYKMKSISCLQNATRIFTDFKGNNLVALQKIYG